MVRPSDRLVWQQDAPSETVIRDYRFAVYVDDEAAGLLSASCAASANPTEFECAAPLPGLTIGEHRISVSAISGPDHFESEQSQPLMVLLAETPTELPGPIDEMPFIGRTIASFQEAVDLSILSHDVALIAERRGRVVAVRQGDDGAVAVRELLPAETIEREVLAIETIDARFVLAVYAERGTASLVRYRVSSSGSLIDRETLLAGIPIRANRPTAALRRGPDGKIYLAAAAETDWKDKFHDVGAWQGKILRLNADGSMPTDTPTITFGAGVDEPHDLIWRESQLWLLGTNGSGVEVLAPVRSFWSKDSSEALGFQLPGKSGARSALVDPDGNFLIGGAPSVWKLAIAAAGKSAGVISNFSDLTGVVGMAYDRDRIVACTTTKLVTFEPRRSR